MPATARPAGSTFAAIVGFRPVLVNDIIVRVYSSRACEMSNHDARLSAQVMLLPDGLPASGIGFSLPLALFKSRCLEQIEQSGNAFRTSRRRSRPVRAPQLGARDLVWSGRRRMRNSFSSSGGVLLVGHPLTHETPHRRPFYLPPVRAPNLGAPTLRSGSASVGFP